LAIGAALAAGGVPPTGKPSTKDQKKALKKQLNSLPSASDHQKEVNREREAIGLDPVQPELARQRSFGRQGLVNAEFPPRMLNPEMVKNADGESGRMFATTDRRTSNRKDSPLPLLAGPCVLNWCTNGFDRVRYG
jgi:hypothetical protein